MRDYVIAVGGTGARCLEAIVFLSAAGIVILGISGWLGGSLVFAHGVAVSAPTSSSKEDSRRAA